MSHAPIRITAEPAWGWSAGLRHPPAASYPAGFFTARQLDELRADPALTIEDDEGEQDQGDPTRSDAGDGGGDVTASGQPPPAPEAPAAEGATPSAPVAEGTHAPESGAPASNPAPDGDGPRDAVAPGAAASTPAAPARAARAGKAKAAA